MAGLYSVAGLLTLLAVMARGFEMGTLKLARRAPGAAIVVLLWPVFAILLLLDEIRRKQERR